MYEHTRSPARITVLPARWPKVSAGMASRHAQATPNIPTTILFQPVPAIPHLWQESRPRGPRCASVAAWRYFNAGCAEFGTKRHGHARQTAIT
jgi:hypothetical protein